VGSRLSSQHASDFQGIFNLLLADLATDASTHGIPVSPKLRDSRLSEEFSRRLAAFTDIWGRNYPDNMRLIDAAQEDLQQWIAQVSPSRAKFQQLRMETQAIRVGTALGVGIAFGVALGVALSLLRHSRFVSGLAIGAVLGYLLLDQQRRGDLLDRLTGAPGPIQQTTQSVYQQETYTAHRATDVAPEAGREQAQQAIDKAWKDMEA
jgi:hypothetical protein